MHKIIVTMYFGEPSTILLASMSQESRYAHNCRTIDHLLNEAQRHHIIVLSCGDWSSFQEFCRRYEGKVEAIYIDQSHVTREKGTGVMEVQLLREFLANRDGGFLKISGKYVIDNFGAVRKFLVNRDVVEFGWRFSGRKMVDTRCILLNREMIFSEWFDLVDDRTGYFFEHAAFDYLLQRKPSAIGFLICRPLIRGMSGTDGREVSYSSWKAFAVRIASKWWQLQISIKGCRKGG